MSRTDPSKSEQAELLFGCDECDAPAAIWCRRVNGNGDFAKSLHQARWLSVREVISLAGYDDMLDEQWERIKKLRGQLQTWRQNIYGDTTQRYDAVYLTSRIDALLEQS